MRMCISDLNVFLELVIVRLNMNNILRNLQNYKNLCKYDFKFAYSSVLALAPQNDP